MSEILRALAEKARGKVAEAQALLAKGAAITAEDIERVKALGTEATAFRGQADAYKAADAGLADVQKWLETPVLPAPVAGAKGVDLLGLTDAGASEIEKRNGQSVLYSEGEGLLDEKTIKTIRSTEYRDAFRRYLRCKGDFGAMSLTEVKTLQEGVDSAGGFTVPEDFLNKLIQKAPTPTRVAGNVARLTTSRDALLIPKVNYVTDDLFTTGIRVNWTGEVPASSTTARVTDPLFGSVRVPVYTAMLSMPLTNDLIEDAAFPLLGWASGKFSETIDLLYDQMVLAGTGVGQPYGIITNPGGAGQPAVVACGNPITADGLIGLGYSLPEQYEDNAKWVMNKTNTALALAKLKDSNGRYLWGMGLQDSGIMVGGAGMPGVGKRVLLGYPVLLQGFMPNTGANNYPLIFGDLNGYYLINRIGFSVQVLRELYAETNQVLLLGRIRFGGQVCEDWRVKIGQQA